MFPTNNKKRFRQTSYFTVFLTLLVFNGCVSSSKEINPELDAQLMSKEDEVKFGYYVDAVVCNEFMILEKERLTKQIAVIGNSLVRHSLRPDLEFTFKIVNSDTVNAFAGPGGFIYITVGLLDILKSKDELAAILGHEIGHVCARHSIKSWNTAQKISKPLAILDLASIIAGLPPVASAGGEIIADVGRKAAHLASVIVYQGYSRGYEYQADELGLQEMSEAGYNPEGMIKVFERLIALREREGRGKGLLLLASHPHTEDRIQNIRKLIAGLEMEK